MDRVGSALRRMAEDLVTERRRVALLERENRELRTQLQSLQRSIDEQEGAATPSGTGPGR